MRLLPHAFGVLLLLVLLTWLLVRGFDTNGSNYAATLRAFDDFALAEASLHRDVLQARAGLLRDYDSLAKASQVIEHAVTRLRSYAQAERLDTGPTERLAAAVDQQEELTERFKTNNALLQNSLSYVGLLSTSPAFDARDAQLAPAAGALAAAILYLTRDISPDTEKALQERIERFAALAPDTGPDADNARALLAHTRLLQGLLPAVDETLKALIAVPSRQPREEIRALFCPPPVRHRGDGATIPADAVFRFAAAACDAGVSRPAAACPCPCSPTARRIRARARGEFDTADQLPPCGNRGKAEPGAGRARPGDRRGTRLCGAGRDPHPDSRMVRGRHGVSAGLAP